MKRKFVKCSNNHIDTFIFMLHPKCWPISWKLDLNYLINAEIKHIKPSFYNWEFVSYQNYLIQSQLINVQKKVYGSSINCTHETSRESQFIDLCKNINQSNNRKASSIDKHNEHLSTIPNSRISNPKNPLH